MPATTNATPYTYHHDPCHILHMPHKAYATHYTYLTLCMPHTCHMHALIYYYYDNQIFKITIIIIKLEYLQIPVNY